MKNNSPNSIRKTNVDEIFETLFDEIVSLELRPGDKISEAEIASRFGVSRQPVRDAFSRLANLDLVLVRPQRATEVKQVSAREIEKSRFIRNAVETEVLKRAAANCDREGENLLIAQIDLQRRAVATNNFSRFAELDYDFHKTLCVVANVEYAFDVIKLEKSKVDRFCLLELTQDAKMQLLLKDHQAIADAVINNDANAALERGLQHLGRLDETIRLVIEQTSK